MPKVRFTGARTGLDRVATSYGFLDRGEVVEVSDADAEGWLTLHPTAVEGVEASDFELVEKKKDKPADTGGEPANTGGEEA